MTTLYGRVVPDGRWVEMHRCPLCMRWLHLWLHRAHHLHLYHGWGLARRRSAA